jgi:uncharacterized protein (TIGR00297 family)
MSEASCARTTLQASPRASSRESTNLPARRAASYTRRLVRILIGFVAAALIAGVARRFGALTLGGAVAATAVGTLAVAAGWNWGVLLIVYFVSSTALSRVGRARKEARTSSIVKKGGARDAVQVLANGALFAGAAVAMIVRPHAQWVALGAGALAASAADTWATEVGTLSRGEPRTILGWRRVPAGTSGAVSLPGTLAMFAGAAFIALVVIILGWTPSLAARVALGGVFGAVFDTLLGALVQARRRCDACNRETERELHDCGQPTRHTGGLAWLDNDLVNFVSGAVGGLLAALVAR